MGIGASNNVRQIKIDPNDTKWLKSTTTNEKKHSIAAAAVKRFASSAQSVSERQISLLRNTLEAAEKRSADAELRVRNLERELATLELRNMELANEATWLKQQLTEHPESPHQKAAAMQKSQNQLNSATTIAPECSKKLEEQLKNYQSEVCHLNYKLSQLEADHQNELKKQRNEHESRISSLETQLANALEHLKSFQGNHYQRSHANDSDSGCDAWTPNALLSSCAVASVSGPLNNAIDALQLSPGLPSAADTDDSEQQNTNYDARQRLKQFALSEDSDIETIVAHNSSMLANPGSGDEYGDHPMNSLSLSSPVNSNVAAHDSCLEHATGGGGLRRGSMLSTLSTSVGKFLRKEQKRTISAQANKRSEQQHQQQLFGLRNVFAFNDGFVPVRVSNDNTSASSVTQSMLSLRPTTADSCDNHHKTTTVTVTVTSNGAANVLQRPLLRASASHETLLPQSLLQPAPLQNNRGKSAPLFQKSLEHSLKLSRAVATQLPEANVEVMSIIAAEDLESRPTSKLTGAVDSASETNTSEPEPDHHKHRHQPMMNKNDDRKPSEIVVSNDREHLEIIGKPPMSVTSTGLADDRRGSTKSESIVLKDSKFRPKVSSSRQSFSAKSTDSGYLGDSFSSSPSSIVAWTQKDRTSPAMFRASSQDIDIDKLLEDISQEP